MSVTEKTHIPSLDTTIDRFVQKLAAQGGPPLYTLSPAGARAVLAGVQAGEIARFEADSEDSPSAVAPPGRLPCASCEAATLREKPGVRMQGMSTDLIERARSGDEEAFRELVDPYRRELQLHCYRILGSLHDAEDGLQETLLAAWQGLRTFEGRSSLRTWLYRIATSRCLNLLRSAHRRGRPDRHQLPPGLPEPTRSGEVLWLEPYPDELLAGVPDHTPGPDARSTGRHSPATVAPSGAARCAG